LNFSAKCLLLRLRRYERKSIKNRSSRRNGVGLAQNLRYKGWSTPTVPSYGLLTAPASVRCLSEDAAKILIQAFINTRLDYCNSLYLGIADGLMSRLSERRRTSHHRSQAVRAHHTSPTSAALAASPRQTSGFQDINPCPSLVGWHRSCVPS